jgi:hypothetical protein
MNIIVISTGTEWKKMKRQFKQIDTRVATWAVDVKNYIYALHNGKWKKVPGRLNHISSGRAGVWGIKGQRIYYRVKVSKKRPLGVRWKRVPGGLKQIDSGPRDVVCGVNNGGYIYCRMRITRYRPYGRYWKRMPGRLTYISCGDYGHWGVNKANQIFFREGVTRSRPLGVRWKRIPGALTQIESGQYGQVVGVNKQGQMFVRAGE